MTAATLKSVEGERITVQHPDDTEDIRTISIADFLEMEIPTRPKLLDPVIGEKALGMIFAARGIGKTFLALAIGYAVASGGALFSWRAPAPRRVVYVDGEMPLAVLQERLRQIVLGADREADRDNFQLLAADYFRDGLPNLSSRDGQELVEPLFEGAALIILDNISTLASAARDNEAESWSSMQEWLLRLRRRGFSVLLIHHAGKGGQQRGTSRREDVLDISIRLKRPEDYVITDGARFELHFDKTRGLHGADVEPFEVKMEALPSEGIVWTTRPVTDSRRDAVMELIAEGRSVRQIGQELGISKSAVDRIKQASRPGGDDE